jgi:hypothetical protein
MRYAATLLFVLGLSSSVALAAQPPVSPAERAAFGKPARAAVRAALAEGGISPVRHARVQIGEISRGPAGVLLRAPVRVRVQGGWVVETTVRGVRGFWAVGRLITGRVHAE